MQKDNKLLYGVDLSKKVTPVMVRDAIVECFLAAHKEVLRCESLTEEEYKRFKDLKIEILVRGAFKDIGGSFDNPKKEDFPKVLERLAEIAAEFRKPEIIDKHKQEMMKILEKLEGQ